MDIDIRCLLQAISNKTDIAIEFDSESEFSVDHTLIKISNNLLHFNGSTILRVNDPRQMLLELRSEKVLKISFDKVNEILRMYHKLTRS